MVEKWMNIQFVSSCAAMFWFAFIFLFIFFSENIREFTCLYGFSPYLFLLLMLSHSRLYWLILLTIRGPFASPFAILFICQYYIDSVWSVSTIMQWTTWSRLYPHSYSMQSNSFTLAQINHIGFCFDLEKLIENERCRDAENSRTARRERGEERAGERRER